MGIADELLLNLAISGVLSGIPLGMIARKAGQSWANGLFAFVPSAFSWRSECRQTAGGGRVRCGPR